VINLPQTQKEFPYLVFFFDKNWKINHPINLVLPPWNTWMAIQFFADFQQSHQSKLGVILS